MSPVPAVALVDPDAQGVESPGPCGVSHRNPRSTGYSFYLRFANLGLIRKELRIV